MNKNVFISIRDVIVSTIFILLTICNSYGTENAVVQSQNGLVLRDGPNQKANKITVVPHNTIVAVLKYSDKEEVIGGISGKWARVKYDKQEGWVFSGYLSKKEYILIPKNIIPRQFSDLDASFNCDGRSWHFDNDVKPKVKDDILYFNFREYYTISTAPDELNEKPIIISGRKYIVFQLEKEQNKHIFFKTQVITNEFKFFNHKIDAYKKIEVKIPLPEEGKTINNFQVSFIGEKCILGIKSVYLEL